MNLPCAALLIERSGAPYHSVMARRCQVVAVDDSTRTASVIVGTALNLKGLRITVRWDQLATTRERAVALIGEAAADVLAATLEAAADEKSASQTKAGAVAAQLALPT